MGGYFSLAYSELLCCVDHDDSREQIRRLWTSIHHDLPP